MIIEEIRNLIREGDTKWTAHCLEKMGERDITISEVRQCIEAGDIIEDYPDDFPHPSCLIYGKISEERVILVVVGCDDETAYIITAYIPNSEKFENDLKTRRR